MAYPSATHPARFPVAGGSPMDPFVHFRRGLLICLIGLFLTGCAEPMIVLPGDALTGEVADAPLDWTDLNAIQVAQLETNPDDPYSVNIWAAGIAGDLYVATGDDGTNWTEYIEQNRDVRIRLADKVFELQAMKVTDGAEKRKVAAEYVRKYDLDTDDNWVLTGQVFRLDRR